ncbi:hypothetical protein CPLU01_15980 [Colletotrichum plurivorum]|uniref:Uncharacterized protein n=1 Tax=Colletotrichum plurivorum TaxID=2175906 RepID=A0A8H6J2Y5_9PEZI|nr:hypothetical protein CPLU01_15980 [Colletotrichum plurivorum]
MASGSSSDSTKESIPESTIATLLEALREVKAASEQQRLASEKQGAVLAELREKIAASKREAAAKQTVERSPSRGFLSHTVIPPSIEDTPAPRSASGLFAAESKTPTTTKSDITMTSAPPLELPPLEPAGETSVEGPQNDRLKEFKFKLHRDHFLKGTANWTSWSTQLHTVAEAYGISKGDELSALEPQ